MPRRPDCLNMDLPDIAEVLQDAEKIIRECFNQYQLNEVFLSFNGGKDCTVLLDLTIHILRDIYKKDDIGKDLKVVHIRTNEPFKEIEDFLQETEKYYGIKLIVSEGEMKATLQRMLDEDPRLKACLMGTRRTDPYSQNLQPMQATDSNWPQIMRVSPLLDWSYHHIWSYILQRQVPYCNLYEKGYTSIGSTHNTWPNPSLAYKDCCGSVLYLPAWRLTDASLERAGRGTKPILTALKHKENGHIRVCE